MEIICSLWNVLTKAIDETLQDGFIFSWLTKLKELS